MKQPAMLALARFEVGQTSRSARGLQDPLFAHRNQPYPPTNKPTLNIDRGGQNLVAQRLRSLLIGRSLQEELNCFADIGQSLLDRLSLRLATLQFRPPCITPVDHPPRLRHCPCLSSTTILPRSPLQLMWHNHQPLATNHQPPATASAARPTQRPDEPNPPSPRRDSLSSPSSHSIASYRATTICAMRSPGWISYGSRPRLRRITRISPR